MWSGDHMDDGLDHFAGLIGRAWISPPQHVKCLVIWSHFLWSQALPYQPYHVVWRSHGWWTWSSCRLDRQSMDQPQKPVNRLVFWSHSLDKERSDPTKCFWSFFFWEKRWTKMNKHFSQTGALPKNCNIFSTPDPWRISLANMWVA